MNLPYRWWRSADFWAGTAIILCLSGMGTLLFLAWFMN